MESLSQHLHRDKVAQQLRMDLHEAYQFLGDALGSLEDAAGLPGKEVDQQIAAWISEIRRIRDEMAPV